MADSSASAEDRANPRAPAPQVVYCTNPECFTVRHRHGKQSHAERRPTIISSGRYPPGTWFRQRCHKCRAWVLVEF